MNSFVLNIRNRPVPSILLLLPALCAIPAVMSYQAGLYVLAGLMGLSLVMFAVRSPKIWLRSVTLLIPLFLLSSDKGVSVIDVLIGIYYVAGLYSWMAYMILVKKTRLVENKFDWLLIFYYVVMIPNSFLAMANGVTFFDWLREYTLYSIVLMYFPLKYYLKDDEKEMKLLLVLFAFSAFITVLYQFYFYVSVLKSGLEYAYQLYYSSRINQLLFTTSSVAGLLLIPYVPKKSHKLLLFIFSFSAAVALILTFSRIFWLAYVINFCLILLFMPKKSSLKILLLLFVIVLSLLAAGRFLYKSYFDIFLNIVGNRATSSSQATQDISLKMRLYEWEVVEGKIAEHPMGGNGLSRSFRYYNPGLLHMLEVHNVHNSYLFMAYRIGIPLSLVFLVVFLAFTIKSLICVFTLKDIFYRNLALISFITFTSFLVTNNLTAQFFYREGIILMAFSFAFTSLCWNKKKEVIWRS